MLFSPFDCEIDVSCWYDFDRGIVMLEFTIEMRTNPRSLGSVLSGSVRKRFVLHKSCHVQSSLWERIVIDWARFCSRSFHLSCTAVQKFQFCSVLSHYGSGSVRVRFYAHPQNLLCEIVHVGGRHFKLVLRNEYSRFT